jgi:hypothetical protein
MVTCAGGIFHNSKGVCHGKIDLGMFYSYLHDPIHR